MENVFTEDVQKGLAIGAPAAMVVGVAGKYTAGTKVGQRIVQSSNKAIGTPIKQAVMSAFSSIKSSSIGKSVGKTSAKFAASSIGKSVAKVAPPGADIAVDVVMGGIAISDTAKANNMSGGQKAYQITGDVVGIGANIGVTLAAGAATGPGFLVALAVMVAQMLGAILDLYFNPFKAYFNRDLKDIRKAYDTGLKKQMLDVGLNWPLEVKPDIMGLFGDEENLKKYKGYMKEYLDQNGIISQEEALAEENILLELKNLRRFTKKFVLNEQGDITGVRSPSRMAIDVLTDNRRNMVDVQADFEQNMLLMLAVSAKVRKMKQQTVIKPSRLKQYLEENYISTIISSFSLISIISIIFLSIFIL